MKIVDSLISGLADVLIAQIPGIDIQPQEDEKPHPESGERFISIHGGPMAWGPSNDENAGIDLMLSINVSITQRTGVVPLDRIYQHLFQRTNGAGILMHDVIDVVRRYRCEILTAANAKALAAGLAGTFLEPLRLLSATAKVTQKGPDHFTADVAMMQKAPDRCLKEFGIVIPITFGECRYLESLLA